MRWLLAVLCLLAVGCASRDQPTPDLLLALTAQPTRPMLSLPTRPVTGTSLPRIHSSFDQTPVPRTPFAFADPAGTSTESGEPAETASPTDSPPYRQATPTPKPVPVTTASPSPLPHRFIVSTQARSYYYCDTDPAWKSLSTVNLRWYDSERELREAYPKLALHEPCR